MTRKEELTQLRKSGLTYLEISKRFGISRQRVHQIVADYKPIEHELVKFIRNERDNNECQICGGIGEEVHHINGVRADNHLHNLVLLCKPCHLKVEKIDRIWKPRSNKAPIIEKTCEFCKNIFVVKGRRRQGKRFCSSNCANQANRKYKTQEEKEGYRQRLKEYRRKIAREYYNKYKNEAWFKEKIRISNKKNYKYEKKG